MQLQRGGDIVKPPNPTLLKNQMSGKLERSPWDPALHDDMAAFEKMLDTLPQ
jgi:hypothetical protein